MPVVAADRTVVIATQHTHTHNFAGAQQSEKSEHQSNNRKI